MRIFSSILLATVLLIVSAIASAKAQIHAGYCDSTRTTADALDCINRHKQDVQKRMNEVFDDVLSSIPLENNKQKDSLSKAQQSWINYRDAQCLWEASLAQTPSLERIYELSCITLLTNLRSDLLSTAITDRKKEMPREFGSSPRWINVLTHEHPETFWRFGKWIHVDLDCNGEDEQIVSGVKFSKKENSPILVLAIAESPLTGKPQTKLFDISLNTESEPTPEKANPRLCHTNIEFSVLSDDQEQASSCHKEVQISATGCTALTLKRHNGDYVLENSLIIDNQNDQNDAANTNE